MTAGGDGAGSWGARLDAFVRARGLGRLVSRVVALEEAGSTQDVARSEAAGGPGGGGVLVVAERQTAGRGRLGRAWHQRPGAGLAMSLSYDARLIDPARVTVGAGLAVALAGEEATGATLGLKWPNDVVTPADALGRRRKLAGVLVERSGDVGVVGVGVNVNHAAEDFAPEVRALAASLAMVRAERGAGGPAIDRCGLLERLLVHLGRTLLDADDAEIDARWRERDALVGTRQALARGGERFEGRIVRIDPRRAIVLRTDLGREVTLDAATVTLVKTPSREG